MMNRIVPAILVMAALAIPVAPARAGPLRELAGKAFHAASELTLKGNPGGHRRLLAIVEHCISVKLLNQPKGIVCK